MSSLPAVLLLQLLCLVSAHQDVRAKQVAVVVGAESVSLPSPPAAGTARRKSSMRRETPSQDAASTDPGSLAVTADLGEPDETEQPQTSKKGSDESSGSKSKTNSSGESIDIVPPDLPVALEAMWAEKHMQVATLLGCTFLLGIFVFECMHKRFSEVDFDSEFVTLNEIEAEQRQGPGFWGTLAGAGKLWSMYLYKVPHEGVAYLVLCAMMIGVTQYANTKLVEWSNDFWNKVQEWGDGDNRKYGPVFKALLVQFLFYAFIFIFAAAYNSYMTSMFQIHVRTRITDRYTNLWLNSRAYYRLELTRGNGESVDNPDQRIQQDSNEFVGASLGIIGGFANSVVQFFLFSATVWKISPPDAFGVDGLFVPGWLFWASLTWSLVVMACVYKIGYRLKAITAAQQRAEADFRYELSTVRHYSEPIVMSRSEDVHGDLIVDRFGAVRRCIWESMMVNKRYNMVMSFFSQTQTVFVLLALGNSFLQGKLKLGAMMSADRAVGLINDSLLWFPSSFGDIQAWMATTERLLALERCIAKNVKAGAAGTDGVDGAGGGGADVYEEPGATGLKTKGLQVWVPEDMLRPSSAETNEDEHEDFLADKKDSEKSFRVVLQDLNLNLEPGARVLLAGPSGAGKSSLLRALSGAWPYAEGSITIPGGACDAMFFATDVFIPRKSLRAAIAYPRREEEVESEGVARVLTLFKLDRLLSLGLDTVKDWNHMLSHGEKARVNLARLALHRPKLAVLDEPLSHLPESMRAPLLGVAFGALPVGATVLVVSHELSADIVSLFNSRYDMDITGKTIVKQ